MFTPKFIITPKINNQIAEIEKLRAIFNHAQILPELAIELRFRATVESVHSSTSIEGNPLNEQQVEKVLQGKLITAPEYAIQEVLNYKNALNWLNKKNQYFDPKKSNSESLEFKEILELHKILMKDLLPTEKVGHLRKGDIFIVDEVDKKQVVQYQGPEAETLEKLLKTFLKWINIQKQENKLHPIILAAFIHYIFVSIHPFADGNGRSTRLITHHYLQSEKYHFNDSLSLDSYYLQNKLAYYQALNRGKFFEDRMFADLTPFLDFFVDGFLTTVQNLMSYVQIGKINTDDQKPIRLNQEELLILDFVYQFKSISLEEAVMAIKLPRRTTQRRLSDLVIKGILSLEGQGPATKYVLDKST